MSALGDINYIKQMYYHPCATPSPQLLIQTGLAAGTIAALELVTAGCLDILKMKLGKPHIHHRSFKALLKGQVTVKRYTPWMQGVILGTAPLEAALNYIWLIGVGTSFVKNWMSMIYQQSNCDQPGAGHFTCPISTTFGGPGGPLNFLLNGLSTGICASVGSNKVVIASGCQATISFTARFRPFQDDPANQGAVTTWLEDGDGVQFNFQTAHTDPKTGETWSAGGLSNFHGGILASREVKLMYEVGSGIMGCSEGTLHISAYGRPIHLIPAGCQPGGPNKFPEPPPPTPKRKPESIDQRKARWDALAAGRNVKRQPKPPKKPKRPRQPKK